MAIEKLTLVNIVGKRENVNTFAKDIYLFNDVQILDAMTEIDEGRFILPVSEINVSGILGLKDLSSGKKSIHLREYEDYQEQLNKIYSGKLKVNQQLVLEAKLDAQAILVEAENFINGVKEKSTELNFVIDQLKETKESLNYYGYLNEIELSMRDLIDLQNFTFSLGSLTMDNADRLKLVYPNVPALIFHVGETDTNEKVYLVICANDFQVETNRVLKALGFNEIKGFDSGYQGTPQQIVSMLSEKRKTLEQEEEKLKAVLDEYLLKNQREAELLFNELTMLSLVDEIKNYLAYSDENFYFTGYLPQSQTNEFSRRTQSEGLLIQFREPTDSESIPTKLKNNWLFRPFEQLVEMYGIPNYLEVDPTPFFALTYILCFGYMFGDVGQGLILFIAGYLVEKRGIKLGGIATRCSIASIIFGFLYGSVFGIETIIPALWIRPMEDTNTILIAAVIVGVVMLITAYIYSLINKYREREEQEEFFGKNGISGFAVYLLILVLALMMYHYLPTNEIVEEVMAAVIIVLTLCVFLAQPLMNLIKHRKFGYEVEGEYYVSSFFEVFEMYLSMLSNTLSFIRVGAFALTHVGMFMAFQTISDMVGGGVIGVAILVFGNIFILILEGLIDFIQCLRLEFYELFGKYYQGNGTAFVTVQEKLNSLNN